ncbi:MAG: hypothetical protein LBU34_13190 [Planctomycetaceae bacterium]|nr:hypothetical protein [Planctomycetaceae bacterium]
MKTLRRNAAYLLISYPKTKTTEKFGNHKIGNRSPNGCVGGLPTTKNYKKHNN